MEAPEIIFLPMVYLGVEDGECPAPIWWNKDKTAKHSEVVKAIEYIRKDKLIAWAKENQEKCFSVVEDDLWQEVIDKIQAL